MNSRASGLDRLFVVPTATQIWSSMKTGMLPERVMTW
jgi:hypothetical protein